MRQSNQHHLPNELRAPLVFRRGPHRSDHSRGRDRPSATICFRALTCNAGKGGDSRNSSPVHRLSALFKYLLVPPPGVCGHG